MKRLKAFALCVVAIGAICIVGAPLASAADGSADVSCDGVQFTYGDFPDGATVDREVVWIDDGSVYDDIEQTDVDPTGDNFVDLSGLGLTGAHTIGYYATWDTGDGAQFIWNTADVDCGGDTGGGGVPPSATADVSCDGVQFTYSGFADGATVDDQLVSIDDGSVYDAIDLTEVDPAGNDTFVDLSDLGLTGAHTISYSASWQTGNGSDEISDSVDVDCGGDTGGGGATPGATADVSCDGVAFAYNDFPDGATVDEQLVSIDDGSVYDDIDLTDVDPTGADTFVDLSDLGLTGAHTISYFATWQTADGSDEISDSVDVDCGGDSGGDGVTPSADAECYGVLFDYGDLPDGTTVDEQLVSIDDGSVYDDIDLTDVDPFGDDTFVDLSDLGLTGEHTISYFATWQTADGSDEISDSVDVDCGDGGAGEEACPPSDISMRWHYATSSKAGEWSKTKSITCPDTLSFSRQALAGDLKVKPGSTFQVGYAFKMPDGGAVTIGASAEFKVDCEGKQKPTRSTWTVPAGQDPITYDVSDGGWQPNGNPYQSGRVQVPRFCKGGKVLLDRGEFTADAS